MTVASDTITIPLAVPLRTHALEGDIVMYVKESEDNPPDVEDVANGSFAIEDVFRVSHKTQPGVDTELLYEGLRIIRMRHERLMEWIKWLLLVRGNADVDRGGSNQPLYLSLSGHTVHDIKGGILDIVPKLPTLNPRREYQLYCTSATAERFLSPYIKAGSVRPTLVDERQDASNKVFPANVKLREYNGGYKPEVRKAAPRGADIQHYIPEDVFVLVPMIPPLYCFHPVEEMFAELYHNNGWYVRLSASYIPWEPAGTTPVNVYRMVA